MALRIKRLRRQCSMVVALVTLTGWAFQVQATEADAKHQWQVLNAQVTKAYWTGDYAQGVPLAEKALKLAQRAFGNRDPRTLTSLSNLGELYKAQGRFGDAEPLLKEVLQGRREVLGSRHPDTIESLNNLAFLNHAQGRLGEEELLLKEALQVRREVLGPSHPDTIESLNNLGGFYQVQGRFGEAEPFLKEALQARRRVLGLLHPDTLISLKDIVDMPDSTVDLLFRFLRQNDGRLSRRARELEFAELTEDEVARIEATYAKAFSG